MRRSWPLSYPDEGRPGRSERAFVAVLVALSLGGIAWLAVGNGSFFDDEIYTLKLIERAGGDSARILALANSTDVHPPLGYLLTNWAHRLLGGWMAVKRLCGGLAAASLGWLVWSAGSTTPRPSWRIAAVLLASAASVPMWAASLRWYAWFLPVYWVLLALALRSRASLMATAWALALGGVVLFHINYLAIVAVPLLALAALWRRRASLDPRELGRAAAVLALGALACLPQLMVLLRVHLAYQGPQAGGLADAVAQTIMTVALGNAVFPLDWLPLAFLAVLAGAALVFVARRPLPEWSVPPLIVVVAGAVAMTFSGLGYRPRNDMFLYVPALLLAGGALAGLPRWAALPGLGLAAAFQVQGAANVIAHRDTTKNSYNMPYRAAVPLIARVARTCGGAPVVQYDRVLAYLLPRAGVRHVGPIAPPARLALRPGDCVVGVDGYRGVIPAAMIAELHAALSRPELLPEGKWSLGEDRYAAIKSRISGEPMPRAQLMVVRYRVVTPLVIAIGQPPRSSATP